MPKRVQTNEAWARFVRERRGVMSQAALGIQFGVTGSYVSLWEQYGVVPSEDLLLSGATRLGDDPTTWLAAAGYASPETVATLGTFGNLAEAAPGYPLRGVVADYGHIAWADKPARWGDSPVEYCVNTDTLHPDFRRGDRLRFRPARTATQGQVAVVAVKAQERLVRLAGTGRGVLLACPANAVDLSHPTELSEARVVGVLVELVRRWEA